MSLFPDEIVEHIFSFISCHRDRNSASLVCKSWFRLERWSRERVFIGNCYAISPERLISRFPRIKSLTLKGKPHFADFNLVPHDWGGDVYPWIEAMARCCPSLEELRLKRMIVSDESIELLSASFPNFKSLVLVSCDGFTTDGIAAVAANCRHLRELDLQENEVEDHRGHWLSHFPESCTSLVSLNFACLKGDVNLRVLERLVARSPNLKSLRLNRSVPLEVLHRILLKATQLVDLGTGGYSHEPRSEQVENVFRALRNCKSIRSLSGFWEVTPAYLHSSVSANLTTLNLSYATIPSAELIELVRQCRKLQRLWVLDHIGDKGLQVVAATCKDLQELRVFPSDPYGAGHAAVTEEGLLAVSKGCPVFNSVLYFCHQMTNAALIAIANNCPRFTRFRLCIIEPKKPDHITKEPLDEGFGAIVRSCRNLHRLSLSGLLTDQAFYYIGKYATRLEMLSVAFAGDSDLAMQYVLRGCKNLRKLEIRDSPFGDGAILEDVAKYETMRSLWMSACNVTFCGCKLLAKKAPRINVEIINDRDPLGENLCNSQWVEKLYVYRTLVGPRKDAPDFVWTV